MRVLCCVLCESSEQTQSHTPTRQTEEERALLCRVRRVSADVDCRVRTRRVPCVSRRVRCRARSARCTRLVLAASVLDLDFGGIRYLKPQICQISEKREYPVSYVELVYEGSPSQHDWVGPSFVLRGGTLTRRDTLEGARGHAAQGAHARTRRRPSAS